MNITQVHVLQCDVEVTHDDLVDPESLHHFPLDGLGGSNMSSAMLRLAHDPEVEAAVMLTDGYIAYPHSPMPYDVLWVVTAHNPDFAPHYGHVIPFLPEQ